MFKTSVKKYIWQIGSLEGANWICFFSKKQIQFAPSKKSYSIYRLTDANDQYQFYNGRSIESYYKTRRIKEYQKKISNNGVSNIQSRH